MARTYYTLCLFNADSLQWEDECGHYSKADMAADYDAVKDDSTHYGAKVIATDGTAADMIAKRDALPVPAKARKAVAARDAAQQAADDAAHGAVVTVAYSYSAKHGYQSRAYLTLNGAKCCRVVAMGDNADDAMGQCKLYVRDLLVSDGNPELARGLRYRNAGKVNATLLTAYAF